MGQTVDQIEARIDRTRDQLGSNIYELERRVDAATDWRQQFRMRPFAFLGAAVVGGAIAGVMLRRRLSSRESTTRSFVPSERVASPRGPSFEVWDTVKTAAISLAGTRLKEYVDQFLPGFDEHYQRAERAVETWARPGR